jgi:hypothetical protein
MEINHEEPQLNNCENLPSQKIAKEIGEMLINVPEIENLSELETPFGLITRLSKNPHNPNISPDYTNKKNVFAGLTDQGPTVIIHFSGEIYGQDQDYFKRLYENCKYVYSNDAVPGAKITPKLLGFDDKSMTILLEKAPHDLTKYFESNNTDEIKNVINKLISFIQKLWIVSQKDSKELCRYVDNFLKPEYDFLQDKKIDSYINDPKTLNLYKEIQEKITEYTANVNMKGFKRGFGLSDMKAANVVEDKDENILSIDVEKFGYCHWLSMLGQFYQDTIKQTPNSQFSDVLKEKILESLSSESDIELAKQLFIIGRMNRLLIPITLRNIVFANEINEPVPESEIFDCLQEINKLIKANSLGEVLK